MAQEQPLHFTTGHLVGTTVGYSTVLSDPLDLDKEVAALQIAVDAVGPMDFDTASSTDALYELNAKVLGELLVRGEEPAVVTEAQVEFILHQIINEDLGTQYIAFMLDGRILTFNYEAAENMANLFELTKNE